MAEGLSFYTFAGEKAVDDFLLCVLDDSLK